MRRQPHPPHPLPKNKKPAREVKGAGDSWRESDGAREGAEVAPPLDAATSVRDSKKPLTDKREQADAGGRAGGSLGLLGFGVQGHGSSDPNSLITHDFLLGLPVPPRLCVTKFRPLDSPWLLGLGREAVVSRGAGSLGVSGLWPSRRLNQRWLCNLRHPLPFHLPAPGAQRT